MAESKVGIIIGNGLSRKAINLDDLLDKGTIFGCNALYRDWNKADYLVAIDERMIDEIQTRLPLRGTQAIFPPEEERYEETTGRRNNAGMVAMREAIKQGHDMLYCLGFDFLLGGKDSLGNVYKDSKNYEPHTQSNMNDNYNRMKYLEWFVCQNKDVNFIFVVPDDAETKSCECENIIGMKMSTFLNKLNN